MAYRIRLTIKVLIGVILKMQKSRNGGPVGRGGGGIGDGRELRIEVILKNAKKIEVGVRSGGGVGWMDVNQELKLF